MSSARNHAKRSHRSERTHALSLARSARRIYTSSRQNRHRAGLFHKLAGLFRRKSETKTNNKGD